MTHAPEEVREVIARLCEVCPKGLDGCGCPETTAAKMLTAYAEMLDRINQICADVAVGKEKELIPEALKLLKLKD